MALITLAQAKTHLNITSSATDPELQSFVAVACALVQGYADRSWDVATVTQAFDGGGQDFVLHSSPITAVTTVAIDGATAAATSYTVDTDSGIVRTDWRTAPGRANVTVTYNVGSATVPALAQHAALETVRHLWATQRGTTMRNVMPGEEYVVGTGFSLPRRVMELLDPIRNVN